VRRRHDKYLLAVRFSPVNDGRIVATYLAWSSGREVGAKLFSAADLGLAAEPQCTGRRAKAQAV